MNSKELEFVRDLLSSTQVDNIFIIPDVLDVTLSSQFNICGEYADLLVASGFYVYEEEDWQILGDVQPTAVYPLKNQEIDQVYYFPPTW